MAVLTEWEDLQIDSIHLLLDQAADVIEYFKQNEKDLSDSDENSSSERPRDIDKEQLQFRLIVYNLYSALDYTYFLLYCHYSNQGQAVYSSKSTQCGFPFKAKGVKISDTLSHDMSGKFISEKLTFLWGSKIGQENNMWKEISDILLAVQPKLTVDSSGKSLSDHPVISLGVEESFSLLHFYRNCCTHRGLIKFEAQDMVFEIDQATRRVSVVNKQNDRVGVFSFRVPKTAYWIQLPEHILNDRPTDQHMPRMLVDVLQQLLDFVRLTTSKLLFSSFLIPRAGEILSGHFSGKCRVLTPEVKPIDGIQNATVTVVLNQGTATEEKLVEKGEHKQMSEAVDKASTLLLWALSKRALYPDRPFKHMYITTHRCDPNPPVQVLDKSSGKTNRMLLNELKQKAKKDFEVLIPADSPIQVGENEQCFQVSKTVTISRGSSNKLIEVNSGPCRGRGKDKASEEAAKVVIEELTRLGFLQFKTSS